MSHNYFRSAHLSYYRGSGNYYWTQPEYLHFSHINIQKGVYIVPYMYESSTCLAMHVGQPNLHVSHLNLYVSYLDLQVNCYLDPHVSYLSLHVSY